MLKLKYKIDPTKCKCSMLCVYKTKTAYEDITFLKFVLIN